jgi:hypothetical protein
MRFFLPDFGYAVSLIRRLKKKYLLLVIKKRPHHARPEYTHALERDRGLGVPARARAAIVTPAVSISFFRREFDDFLYAPIAAERDEMPLSVLSALARLDIDPWKEAAELSELPKFTAAQRLAALIAQLPGGRWTQADSRAIADRLIELLPRRSNSKIPLAEKDYGIREMTGSAATKMLIYAALAAAITVVAANFELSPRGDNVDAPPPMSRPSFSQ